MSYFFGLRLENKGREKVALALFLMRVPFGGTDEFLGTGRRSRPLRGRCDR